MMPSRKRRSRRPTLASTKRPHLPASQPRCSQTGQHTESVSAATAPAADANEPPPGSDKKWYILKVQSNREDTIADGLHRHVAIAGLEPYFGEIIVPTEMVTEFKNGKKKVVERQALSRLHRRSHGDQRGHLVPRSRHSRHW